MFHGNKTADYDTPSTVNSSKPGVVKLKICVEVKETLDVLSFAGLVHSKHHLLSP